MTALLSSVVRLLSHVRRRFLGHVRDRGRPAFRSRRLSRRTLLVTSVLAVTMCLGGAWVVLRSAAFAVRTVSVAGTARLTPAEVTRAARVQPGSSLATIDVDAVAQRVGKLAPVRKVEVLRRWPDTVAITIVERKAVAVRRGAHRSYVLVDTSGVAFAAVHKKPKGLSLISARSDLDSSGRVRTDPAALRAALAVLADVPVSLRPHVLEVRATGADEVTLRLTRGRKVLWGAPTRGARKAQVLAVLATRKAKVYDITAPDAPTTRK